MKRITLIPPAVAPAQPPTMLMKSSNTWAATGQL